MKPLEQAGSKNLSSRTPNAARVIKRGSVIVKVYPTPTVKGAKKYRAWTVVHHFAGKRVRKKFANKGEAVLEADRIAKNLSEGKTALLSLTTADVATFQRARQLLAATGKSMELAASEYAEAIKELPKGINLTEAVRFYLKQHPPNYRAWTVEEVIHELLEAKQADVTAGELSEVWLKDLQSRLNRFKQTFQCPINSITGPEIEDWLRGLKDAGGERLALKTRNNFLICVRALFSFARRRGCLTTETDALASVELPAAGPGKIQVYTPAEMQAILTANWRKGSDGPDDDLIPYLVLRAFAGPRDAEVCRMHWSDIHFATEAIAAAPEKDGQFGWIPLESHITKTQKDRLIPIQANLADWLEAYRYRKGKIVPYANVTNPLLKTIRAAGVMPRHNALRDSYASYRSAQTQDLGKVSQETGHSKKRLETSYRTVKMPNGKIITPAVAADWFAICPNIVSQKILQLEFAR